jgi:hypothetical protein
MVEDNVIVDLQNKLTQVDDRWRLIVLKGMLIKVKNLF